MLMAGLAKEYFDLREAHRDPMDQAKSHEVAVDQGQHVFEEA